ncbi:MAG: Hcp1 family type secretion system effector [Bacilli bacterium]|nr:Hcp1 family type secretion system effector [Bacilli bacterium]
MFKATKLKKMVVILSTLILIFALPVSAFADSYGLVLNGIQGSGNTGGPGAINVYSISFGVSTPAQQTPGTGGNTGKPQYSDFSIQKAMDKSSLPILLHLATGKPILDGTFYVQKSDGSKPFTYLKIHLKNIVITSYNISGASGGDRPSESITIRAQQMDFEYTDLKADGTPGQTQKLSIDEANNTAN